MSRVTTTHLGRHHPGDVHQTEAQASHEAVGDQQLGHGPGVAGGQQPQGRHQRAGHADQPRPVSCDQARHHGATGEIHRDLR